MSEVSNMGNDKAIYYWSQEKRGCTIKGFKVRIGSGTGKQNNQKTILPFDSGNSATEKFQVVIALHFFIESFFSCLSISSAMT